MGRLKEVVEQCQSLEKELEEKKVDLASLHTESAARRNVPNLGPISSNPNPAGLQLGVLEQSLPTGDLTAEESDPNVSLPGGVDGGDAGGQ